MTKEEIEKLAEEWADLYYTKGSERISAITEDAEFLNRKHNFYEGYKQGMECETTSLKAEVESLQSQLAESQKRENVMAKIADRAQDINEELLAKCNKAEADKVELLEKHKTDVMEAFNQGYREGELDASSPNILNIDISKFSNAEDYYKDKFESN